MGKMKQLLSLLFSVLLLISTALPAEAADEEYTYTIRIYAGQQGFIDGGEVLVYENMKLGQQIAFNQRQVTLKDGSKYYVRGIRESGKDNNTVSPNPSFAVTGDKDYVVAYGLLNDAVAYTVNYQDLAGNALAPSETYYGNVGDKPVIAFLYIDGYQPQAYNLTKTLDRNVANNEFTFIYLPVTPEVIVIPAEPAPVEPVAPVVPTPEQPVPPVPEVPVVPPPGPINPVVEAVRRGVGGLLEDLADEDVPTGGPANLDDIITGEPETLVDLDDGEVPLAPFVEDDDTFLNVVNGNAFLVWIPMPVKIFILAVFALLVGLGVRQMVKSRKGKKS